MSVFPVTSCCSATQTSKAMSGPPRLGGVSYIIQLPPGSNSGGVGVIKSLWNGSETLQLTQGIENAMSPTTWGARSNTPTA